MAVLYGLFLFMGVTSLVGNQFFERLRLWIMDPHHYPRTHYVRQVPMREIHRFTAIQLAGLVVLWVVKVSPLALIFPLFIVLLVPSASPSTAFSKPAISIPSIATWRKSRSSAKPAAEGAPRVPNPTIQRSA